MPDTPSTSTAAFFQAKNAHDTEALLPLFAADAVVHDEDQDFKGIDAIRAWSIDAISRYHGLHFDVTDVERSGNNETVTALVSGDFEGSPVPLRFMFEIDDERIRHLQIEP
jgi:ketosteroid isomerase-like protein